VAGENCSFLFVILNLFQDPWAETERRFRAVRNGCAKGADHRAVMRHES